MPKLLEAVQGLKLVEVTEPEQLRIWNELMLSEHPLGECRLVGRQLRYLIASGHGCLGGIGFGSAALYLESRDEWIGWSAAQRVEHLQRVINIIPFLDRPRVRCPNLAAHVLGRCARRVAKDFERRYGLRSWLLESFVESPKYAGSCYQAANWTLLRAITLDAVIAWRIRLLVLLGREVPGLPSDLIFGSNECAVLELLAKKKNLSLSEAIIVIAKLGGYLNRKCDAHPGCECLWKGYAQFRAMVQIVGLSRRRVRDADD